MLFLRATRYNFSLFKYRMSKDEMATLTAAKYNVPHNNEQKLPKYTRVKE